MSPPNQPGASPFPPSAFKPFGDADGTIEERIVAASSEVAQAQSQLNNSIARIGMTKAYSGEDPQMQLQMAIERYARAIARAEMLAILNSEDFFLAMTNSAAKTRSNT